MKQITVHITIGSHDFYVVDEVTIEKSWKFSSDSCTITMPRGLLSQGSLGAVEAPKLDKVLKVGDKVVVRLGYDFEFQTEFEGFVSEISPDIPAKITCMDGMWLLKQTKVSGSWRTIGLTQLLSNIIPSTVQYVVNSEVSLGKFRLDQVAAFEVLKKLKEVYGLVSYFKENILYVGFAYEQTSQRVDFHFQKNLSENQGLTFEREDNVKISLKAISIQADGSKVEQIVGDQDGGQRTLHLPIGLTAAEVKKLAEEQIKLFRFDGYRGKLSAFGQPYIEHGDIAVLTDDLYPDRAGSYFVDSVNVKFGAGGYRRVLELGNIVS